MDTPELGLLLAPGGDLPVVQRKLGPHHTHESSDGGRVVGLNHPKSSAEKAVSLIQEITSDPLRFGKGQVAGWSYDKPYGKL